MAFLKEETDNVLIINYNLESLNITNKVPGYFTENLLPDSPPLPPSLTKGCLSL